MRAPITSCAYWCMCVFFGVVTRGGALGVCWLVCEGWVAVASSCALAGCAVSRLGCEGVRLCAPTTRWWWDAE